MGKWVYSTNEEDYFSDKFDTKEEAIVDAKNQLDADIIYVGQTVSVFPHIYAEDVIERAGEQMYEQNGEYAEDYLTNVPDDVEQELEEELNKVFKKWIEKHDYTPTFYQVANIEEVKLEREGE